MSYKNTGFFSRPMPFTPNFIDPANKSDEALWFVYHQDRLCGLFIIRTGS
jgi:hypothetical protein